MQVAKPHFTDLMIALILRETRGRYGRRKIGYIWGLIEPGMYVMIALTIFYITGRKILTDWSMPLFILTGMGPWMLFFRTDNYLRHAYGDNNSLGYHPVLAPVHFLIARWLVESATVIVFVVLSFFIYGLFWDDPRAIPEYVTPIVTSCILALLLGWGVGSCLAPLMVRFPGFAYVLGYGVRVLFLTAGVFYIPDYAPPIYRNIIYYNPMMHVVALFRHGYSAFYPSQDMNPYYSLFVALILIFIGLAVERFFVRRWPPG